MNSIRLLKNTSRRSLSFYPCLAMGCLALLALPMNSHAGDLVDNWDFLSPGAPPESGLFGKVNIPVRFSNVSVGGAVDQTSTPPNPFPGTTRALYIDSTSGTTARLRTRPFLDEMPAKGSYEISFRLQDGGFYFNIGTIPLPWAPEDATSYAEVDQFFAVRMSMGDALMRGKTRLITEDVATLAAEENYSFRVEWETTGDEVVFKFFLNGKPLTDKSGAPDSVSVPQSQFAAGGLGFSIFTTNSKIFIGGIQADPLNR